jgi:hypothetical protein
MSRYSLSSKKLFKANAAINLSILVAVLASGTTSCRFFSRSKLATSTQQRHPELDRLANEFGRIRALFPQPEFTEITKQIYSRFKLIYEEPEEGLNKPALIFVLNSLPGTGKTFYAQQVARALGIEHKESYHVYEMKASDHYLNFEKIPQFAATKASIESVLQNRAIQPAVLLYDEYSHAATLAGSSKDTLQEQITDLRKRLEEAELASVAKRIKEKITELRRQAKFERISRNISNSADGTETDDGALEFVLGEMKETGDQLANTYAEAAKELRQISDAKAATDTSEIQNLKAKSDENLQILWAALGNGRIPKKDLKSDTSLGLQLQSTAEQVNPKLKEQKLKFIERIVKDTQRNKLNKELREIEEAELAAQVQPQPTGYRPPSPGGFNSLIGLEPRPTAKPPPEQTDRKRIIIDQLSAVDQAITTIDNEIKNIETDIDGEVSRVKHVMQSIVAAYGPDVVDDVARDLGINDTDQVWNREFTNKVSDFTASAGITPADVEPLLAVLKDELLRINKTGGPADSLLSLFKEQPHRFYSVYNKSLVSRSVDEDRLTGNIVIFLAGNVLSLQERVITNVLAKGESQCQTPSNSSGSSLPFYRDPDCLLKITKDVLKEPGSAAEMEDTLLRVLGKKTIDLKEFKDANPIESNALAFKSRIGPIRFILPPSSKDYKGFLSRQLDAVKTSFTKSTGVGLLFNDRVIEDFLYPKFVNSQLGFRNLVDRARYEFDLTLDNEVRAVIGQVGTAKPDQPVAPNPTKKCAIKDSITSLGDKVSYTGKVPIEPVHTAYVDFAPGNRPANGELIFGGISNLEGKKKSRQWFKLKETTILEDDAIDRKLTTFQRVAYARYIAAIYGSMGLLAGSLPTAPIPLGSSVGGIPTAARGTTPTELDLSSFRSNLQFYSIEIQASIGAIAAYNAIDRLEQPPPELVQRAASTKVMIDDLWDKLQVQIKLGFDMERLLGRDPRNDVTGKPVSESDAIFREFMRIHRSNSSKKQLSEDDKDAVYKSVLNYFVDFFEKNRDSLAVIESIASTVQDRLEQLAAQSSSKSEVTAEEIERIFNDVVGIKFVTQPGSHGTVRCNAYREAYGLELEFGIGEPLTPARELVARGFFGTVGARAVQDLNRIARIFRDPTKTAAEGDD